MMVLSDSPISTADKDELRRGPLAKKVAEMISDIKETESFVIAIEGPWGAGKTSFINLMLSDLSSDVAYFIFNPWNFSDQDSLLRDFFLHYSEIIDRLLGRESARKIKQYASALSSIDLGISYHGFSISPFSWLKYWTQEKSLENTRKELNTILAKIPTKIVVVIDDIDRLDTLETKLVMKLVKLTADFPNTVFVLAYDRDRIEQRITNADQGLDGHEYLKKIVQVSFSLPEPDPEDIKSILVRDLDKTIEGVYGKVELVGQNESRWNEMIIAGFMELFTTIRDIKRYISSLRLDWSIMGNVDVNLVDFIIVESIRVFAPKFYDAIPDNKDLFLGTDSFRVRTHVRDEQTQNKLRYEELLKLVPAEIREQIDGLCRNLFPSIDSRSHHAGNNEAWDTELRVCSAEKFGFYFQLGVPAGSISESETKFVMSLLESEADFMAAAIEFDKQNKLRPILTKILTFRKDLTREKLKNLISALWSLEGSILDERNQVFDFDDFQTQTLRIAFNGIKDVIESKSERFSFIKELIDESPTLFFPTQFVAVLAQSQAKGSDSLVSETELNSLKESAISKIKASAEAGALPKNKKLLFILYRWSEWESLSAVQEYIRKIISTRHGLLAFIRSAVGQVISSAGNYKTVDRKSIDGLIPISEIESKLSELTAVDEEMLDSATKEAIALFRKPPSSNFPGD